MYWGRATLCPVAYRIGQKDDGKTDWPNLLIASASLYALDVPPIRNLPDTYVVHGRFGMMASLQVALAQREGVDLEHVEVDADHATVRITRSGEAYGHLETVTMKQAVQAGWAKRNPSYQTMPQKMLAARAMTAAINTYAPGVLRGIASRVAPVAQLDLDGFTLERATPGGAGASTSALGAPAPPGYMSEIASDALVAAVLVRLHRLEKVAPDLVADLRAEWKALKGPVIALGAERPVYLPDALVLDYMLEETEGALRSSGVAVHDGGPTPPNVHDDAPESGGMEPDDVGYATVDPGRPF